MPLRTTTYDMPTPRKFRTSRAVDGDVNVKIAFSFFFGSEKPIQTHGSVEPHVFGCVFR